MSSSARLFNCAYCKCQVTICTSCDRGNIYCKQCAPLARVKSQHAAAKRYQNSRKGKLNNAKRQKAFRLRKKQKVTHQGSPKLASYDALSNKPNSVPKVTKNIISSTPEQKVYCDFCDRSCSNLVRTGFVRYQQNKNRKIIWPMGP